MDREAVITKIIEDMPKWLKRDPQGFWEHVNTLEQEYLKNLTDKDLLEVELS